MRTEIVRMNLTAMHRTERAMIRALIVNGLRHARADVNHKLEIIADGEATVRMIDEIDAE